MPINQVRVLTLHAGENRETTLYRLEKGWTLRFVLGASLHAKTVRLFCNHPQDKSAQFDRLLFYELQWRNPSGMKCDKVDVFAEVHIVTAGSFNYFFTIDGSQDPKNADGQGYFLIDPTLSLGSDKEDITLDCIQCQTVITKLLGPLSEWWARLQVAKETGYNMVHFTPVQELGISNSAYSIRNQLRLNPLYYDKDKENTLDDVEDIVNKMKKDWQVLSLTDLVYNHTAKDSPWIQDHPDSVYNLQNSPHLKPAYIIDRIFHHFSLEVSKEKWKDKGIPLLIDNEGQLQRMKEVLLNEVFPHYNLHEFYCVSEENILKSFRKKIQENTLINNNDSEVVIKQDAEYRRLESTLDMNTVLYFYNIDREEGGRPGVTNRQDRINQCCIQLRQKIEQLNNGKKSMINEHIGVAVENFLANVRWRFLADDGPKIGIVTEDEPLMFEYFVVPPAHEGSVNKEEAMIENGGAQYIFAVNGWVMNDDPLRNFAEEGSLIYLRRELVAWGDSVKLRFGKCPEDSPYLWQHMRQYTEDTVRIFHGVRLDNCHGTPMHVAEYMMDVARKIRPDLYVIGELFTGSEALDNLFMNRLGINSLIREALSAWDAHEEGRLVHRYGGVPIGSFVQPRVKPLTPTVAHALFYDQTHDNPSPIEKRSAYDIWPSAALVAMACCATGSNRGYDQLVPHHVHVVTEERLYTSWANWEKPDSAYVNDTFGITCGKRALNQLHFHMGITGFSQVFVDQLTSDTVSVTRHNPQTHESIVLVARTSFSHPSNPKCPGHHIRPLNLQGVINEILFEGSIGVCHDYEYKKDKSNVNGLPDYYLNLRQHIKPEESELCHVTVVKDDVTISWKNFTPGSVIAFRSSLPPRSKEAILQIRRGLGQFGYLMRSYSGSTMFDDTWDKSNFRVIVSNLDLASLNRVLYRVDAEERDDGYGIGAYDVPGFGAFVYCGLRGIISVLADIRPTNDLGHSICANLRNGNWLIDYISNRLQLHTGTYDLGMWFESIFSHLKEAPRYLIPCYFDALVTGAYVVMREMVIQQMSDFVRDGSTFVQALSMGSVQFCGYVKTSKLPPLSPNLKSPKPRQEKELKTDKQYEALLSLAAGFPHFASGYMRNWGRDTFIAARGLTLLTGRHQETRCLILAFGGTLRHGLIPNLLNEGTGARYNCRDAIWWWLQCIQEYCQHVPQGQTLLKDTVSRLYPTDDSEPTAVDQPLCDVIQEALEKHSQGLKYRERNAGFKIDSQMTDKGFNVEIGVDWVTGFVFGGNEWNCGTWMDKMGSSGKAGNKGKPATPRDGSAVEIIGLSMSAVRWLSEMNSKGFYPYDGVTATIDGKERKIPYTEWADKIKLNFEKYFWINDTADPDNEPKPELINRRGIYKDSYFATQFWADYQLRPNFSVAMVVAPELFTSERAWLALTAAQDVLLGPLGMKTLDPKDWGYVGDYDNSNDSTDGLVACGFNYHQGPEWLWPIGFFLRAKLFFASKLEKSRPGVLKETIGFIETTLANHYLELMKSPWQSLPELTNSNGSYCRDSCRGQAWSVGCLLEVLYDLEKMENGLQTLSTSDSIPDINGNL